MSMTNDQICGAISYGWPGKEYSVRGDKVIFIEGVANLPANAELQSALDAYAAHVSATAYRGKRAAEYPVIGDQLDAIWKELNARRINGENLVQDADDMLDAVLAVKRAHPKPE